MRYSFLVEFDGPDPRPRISSKTTLTMHTGGGPAATGRIIAVQFGDIFQERDDLEEQVEQQGD